jgi:DNA-binding CsgD family transcriptional regulator
MESILRRISEAATLPLIWRQMTRFFRQNGFAANSYYIIRHGSSFPATMPLQHGFPRGVVEAYLSEDFQRLDVVPRAALAAGIAVNWQEVWETMQVTPDERAFQLAMRAAGFSQGYSLPCYGPGNRNAVVGISGMTRPDMPEAGELAVLHFAAQAAHLRMCALFAREVTIDRQLSRREKEILDWVARGKSNSVIADILEISTGTVDTYIRRIYEKLEVSDRTSAAVKGVGLGLIAA